MVIQIIEDDVLLTFKEAMGYLKVSRSTLYRLMWSGQLVGHKVGSTWRFCREDLRACVGIGRDEAIEKEDPMAMEMPSVIEMLTAMEMQTGRGIATSVPDIAIS